MIHRGVGQPPAPSATCIPQPAFRRDQATAPEVRSARSCPRLPSRPRCITVTSQACLAARPLSRRCSHEFTGPACGGAASNFVRRAGAPRRSGLPGTANDTSAPERLQKRRSALGQVPLPLQRVHLAVGGGLPPKRGQGGASHRRWPARWRGSRSWRIRGLLRRARRALPSCWHRHLPPSAFAWVPMSGRSSLRQRRRHRHGRCSAPIAAAR
jgi:hypothetical protein